MLGQRRDCSRPLLLLLLFLFFFFSCLDSLSLLLLIFKRFAENKQYCFCFPLLQFVLFFVIHLRHFYFSVLLSLLLLHLFTFWQTHFFFDTPSVVFRRSATVLNHIRSSSQWNRYGALSAIRCKNRTVHESNNFSLDSLSQTNSQSRRRKHSHAHGQASKCQSPQHPLQDLRHYRGQLGKQTCRPAQNGSWNRYQHYLHHYSQVR